MSTSQNTGLRRRPVEWWERRQLEHNGCTAAEWSAVRICDGTDLDAVRNVRFIGNVSLGILRGDAGECIVNATLHDCHVGDHCEIRNIGGLIRNCNIGNRVRIVDTGYVEFEPESRCGVGTQVDVLDETGSRPVTIYPGLSAQMALLMARMPKWCANHLAPILRDGLMIYSAPNSIGDDARILGCGMLLNVKVGHEVKIMGAKVLRNGTIVNNAAPGRALAYVGDSVDAENFVLEDGTLDSGAIVRNCYIGQGASLSKGFSAHDSLFFANSTLENGEACALFAGPYTVSMHKSSLLIGCQTSFMNAGSGSNQSNHMYKLGPVHWGILERGVKTSSFSYLMLGAKIGAFSLLMGQHKTHPDSSQFPFSYLFGDEKGATVVVPGMMLRSCGLMRDEQKWPSRDRRLKRKLPLHDRIIFDVLNPMTVENMLTAVDVIAELLARPADDDRVIRYRGMKFYRAGLERASVLYEWAIFKYLSIHVPDGFANPEPKGESGEWLDIAGLPIRRSDLDRALASRTLEEVEGVFTEAFDRYRELERDWIENRFPARWRKSPEVIREYAANFDRMVADDRTRYLADLDAQNRMLEL